MCPISRSNFVVLFSEKLHSIFIFRISYVNLLCVCEEKGRILVLQTVSSIILCVQRMP